MDFYLKNCSVSEIPEVKQPVDFTFDVDSDRRSATLNFRNFAEKVTTFFGSDDQSKIVLHQEQIEKLPHDLVHLCFSGNPETDDLLGVGYTPDFVYKTRDGKYGAIEFLTRENNSQKSLDEGIRSKIDWYKPIMGSYISEFNVVAVNLSSVRTISGELDKIRSGILIDAYKKGLKVRNHFYRYCGAKKTGEPEDVKKLSEMFRTYKQVLLDSPKAEDLKMEKNLLQHMEDGCRTIQSRESYASDTLSFDDYQRKMTSAGLRKDYTTAVHVPMLSVSRTDDINEVLNEDNYVTEGGPYAKIFNSSMKRFAKYPHSMKDATTLEAQSIAQNGELKDSKFKTKEDVIKVTFHEQEMLDLAERGVGAKKWRENDRVKIKRKKSQIPYSMDVDTEQLDLWVNRSVTDVDVSRNDSNFVNFERMFDLSMKFCKEAKKGENVMDSRELLKEFYGTRLIQQVEFFERVCQEICLNCTRNMKSSRRSMDFIVRWVPGYEAFVVIKTTRYARSSNFYYSIFFKGTNSNVGVFEPSYFLSNGWQYTKFLSTDRNRLSHFQGITGTIISLSGLWVDIFGSGLSHKTRLDDFNSVRQSIRTAVLILFSSSSHLSQTLQQLRFYYMEIFSGKYNSKKKAEKITSKLPEVLRNPLECWLLKNLFEIHKLTEERKANFNMRSVSEEDQNEAFDLRDRTKNLEPMRTPFGFSIRNADDLVNAMYWCNLHNRDIGEQGHGVTRILEKTIKREYQFIERTKNLTKNQKREYCLKETLNPNLLDVFQSSKISIEMSSVILKNKILKIRSLEELPDAWNKEYAKRIVTYCLRSNIKDLGTTKVSTVDFSIQKKGEEINDVGKRRKCVEEVIKAIDDGTIKEHKTALNLQNVMWSIKRTEDGCLKVTIFKKLQIGGYREIYVLTIRGRLVVKVFNDIFRCIAEDIPEEKLTDEKSKDSFVGSHYTNRMILCKKENSKYATTFKVASDMTNWANLFSLYEFEKMIDSLLPDMFKDFCFDVLEMVRQKKLQLPRALIEGWTGDLVSDETKYTKLVEEEFRGLKEPIVCGKGQQWVKNETNMMQGILHYVSTVYHVLHLETLKESVSSTLEKMFKVKVLFEYEVSSDDEGILISLVSSEQKDLNRASSFLDREWETIKMTIDKLFGIRTSYEKSTTCWSELFEFNSKFYVRNSVATPLIKFVARANDTIPQDSLHKKISDMFSSLRQVRENGASGLLCNWISMTQSITHLNSVGFSCGVPELNCLMSDLWNKCPLTFFGFYPVQSSITAGLVDCKYYNWRACCNDDTGTLNYICSLFMNENDPMYLENTTDVSMTYSIFKKSKHKAMIKRIGANIIADSEMTERDIEVELSEPENILEVKDALKRMSVSSGVARSMAFLTRSDSVRMSIYQMWSAMYRDPNGKITSLTGLYESLLKKVKTVRTEHIFPMQPEMRLILDLEDSAYVIDDREFDMRRIYRIVAPYYLPPDFAEHMNDLLLRCWFGKKTGMRATTSNLLLKELNKKLPFIVIDGDISTRLKRSLELSPFETYRQLYNFVVSYAERSKPIKLLCVGSGKRGVAGVDSLIKYNTMSGKMVSRVETKLDIQADLSTINEESYDIKLTTLKLDDRVKSWYDIIKNSDHKARDELTRWFEEDIMEKTEKMSDLVYKSLRGKTKGNNENSKFFKHCQGELSTSQYVRLVRRTEFFLNAVPVWTNSGQREGDHESLITKEGCTIRAQWKESSSQWKVESTKTDKTDLPHDMLIGGVIGDYKKVPFLSVPDLKFQRFLWMGNALQAEFVTNSGKRVYELVPWCRSTGSTYDNVFLDGKHRFKKIQDEDEELELDVDYDLISVWCTGERLNNLDIQILLTTTLVEGSYRSRMCAESIINYSRRFESKRTHFQLLERTNSGNDLKEQSSLREEEEEDTIDFNTIFRNMSAIEMIRAISSDLADLDYDEEEMAQEYFEDFSEDVTEAMMMGDNLATFSREGYNASLEFNTIFRAIMTAVSKYSKVQPKYRKLAVSPMEIKIGELYFKE